MQFKKWEIHTVFLHFLNFRLSQNLSASALADLIRASLNLSEIQEGRLGEVNSFFAPSAASQNTLLRTFYKTENDLIACLFVKNDDARLVFMTSYSVKTQTIMAQNQSFHLFAEEVDCADSTTEVWLRGRTFAVNEPVGEDFLLYRYKG